MANLQAALASSASFLTGWAARTFGQVLPRQHDPFPPGDECKHGVGVPYNLMTVMVTDENGNPKKLSFSTVMHRLYDKMMYEVLFQFFGQT